MDLYPLKFEPIFKNMLWGGRRLGQRFGYALPDGPVGEAWVLSDQGSNLSRVQNGPLAGRTLRELMQTYGPELLGRSGRGQQRFPLLLKFLDAREPLSVQVHPADHHQHLIPEGDRGKTEAWVVLESEAGSRIFAGLKPGVGPAELRAALADGTVADCLHQFSPRPGDCLFLAAGTVHALGAGIVLFEVQQTSDVTFRLFDWNRLDARTGQPRPLHLEQSLQCIDFAAGPCRPIAPVVESEAPLRRERLVECPYFRLSRLECGRPFEVAGSGSCRILVGIAGVAAVEHAGKSWPIRGGEVLLLPAALDSCWCRPEGEPVTLLECVPGDS